MIYLTSSEEIAKQVDSIFAQTAELSGALMKESKKIAMIADVLAQARERGSKIYIMGNGGSASTASHAVNDLSKMAGLGALALNDNVPSMLAWANDLSYEHIFDEQLKRLLKKGDIVIGLSGSGNSPNVINALTYAKQQGNYTIGLSGGVSNMDGGKLAKLADLSVTIPSQSMQHSENFHLVIVHMLCVILRNDQN